MKNNEIKKVRLFQINTFVEGHYKGNPAGVCLLPEEESEDYYRRVAVKMDLPETAFVYKEDNTLKMRWFTRSGMEVDLCGHATLASACILWEKGFVAQGEKIYFQTKSGTLSAKQEGEYITLGFPLEKIIEVNSDEYDFQDIMGLVPVYIVRTRFDYLLVVGSENAVKNLTPDFKKLGKIKTRGIIVTAKSTSMEYDYVNRFFAPAVGINEDPVTGSAHTVLGIYWSPILKKKKLIGYQASPEGGIVRVEVLKDVVLLSGRAQEVVVSNEVKKTIQSF